MPCTDLTVLSDIGNQLVVANAAARPTGVSLYAGRRIYQSDTQQELMYDGTGWVCMSEPAQSWTPTVTNFNVGTGGSAARSGYYHRSDGWCDIKGFNTLGSTGSSVGGALTLVLPITAESVERGQLQITLLDTGTNTYPGWHDVGTTTVALYANVANLTYVAAAVATTTVPFTWASGDTVSFTGRYRMASRYS